MHEGAETIKCLVGSQTLPPQGDLNQNKQTKKKEKEKKKKQWSLGRTGDKQHSTLLSNMNIKKYPILQPKIESGPFPYTMPTRE